MSYSIKEFEISSKDNYDTEMNNISYFLKCMNPKDYQRKRKTTMKKGASGYITVIENKKTNINYALKTTNESISRFGRLFAHSLSLYFLIDHPCIIEFVGYYFWKKKGSQILKYYPNGSLEDLIRLQRSERTEICLNDTQKLIIIYGIASGMCYLHSLDIVYRNLKLANILIDDYFYPKICDFETSTFIDDIKTSQTVKQISAKIMAPEFIKNFEEYNRAKPIDVYSFSMVLYEFLTNEDPYNTDNPMEIIEKVRNGERPELKDTIPNCYKKLISDCWSKDTEKRPTFAEIVKTLETNKEFVQNVDEAKFRKYINYVKGQQQISHEHEEIHRIEFIENNTKIHLSLISDPIDLNKFTKLKNNIGYGSFGKAYKVVDKKSKEILACKISNSLLEFCDDDLLKCIERELNILSEIKFPSILKFYGYSLNISSQK